MGGRNQGNSIVRLVANLDQWYQACSWPVEFNVASCLKNMDLLFKTEAWIIFFLPYVLLWKLSICSGGIYIPLANTVKALSSFLKQQALVLIKGRIADLMGHWFDPRWHIPCWCLKLNAFFCLHLYRLYIRGQEVTLFSGLSRAHLEKLCYFQTFTITKD